MIGLRPIGGSNGKYSNIQKCSSWFNGLIILLRTGTGTGTGNRSGTIGNNGSWSLFLSWTSVNISAWHIRTHWSWFLVLYRSRSRIVWLRLRPGQRPGFLLCQSSFLYQSRSRSRAMCISHTLGNKKWQRKNNQLHILVTKASHPIHTYLN